MGVHDVFHDPNCSVSSRSLVRFGWIAARQTESALGGAVARSFVVSPQLAHSERGRVGALQRQHHLSTMLELGDRIQRDAAQLLDQAAFDGEDLPSATVSAEARFAVPEDRAAFMDAYLACLRDLLERYGSSEGEPFRIVMAVYPDGSR